MFWNIVPYEPYHSSINSVHVKLLSETLVEFAFMLRTGLFTSFTWISALLMNDKPISTIL